MRGADQEGPGEKERVIHTDRRSMDAWQSGNEWDE